MVVSCGTRRTEVTGIMEQETRSDHHKSTSPINLIIGRLDKRMVAVRNEVIILPAKRDIHLTAR